MQDIDPNEIYRQKYAHFGRMNDMLYELTIIFSSLIGALWCFAHISQGKYICVFAGDGIRSFSFDHFYIHSSQISFGAWRLH